MPTSTHCNLKLIFFIFLFWQILLIYLSYGTENFLKLKYKFEKFQACEKCDENSKIFYEMENKKFCPRCTLGYLSYYFARSETINEIKFYCTDIVFQSITHSYEFKKKKKFPCNLIINDLVNEEINKKKSILQKRKAANQSFDLFLIVNEILIKIKEILLEKSKCSKCFNSRFYLMKIICCKKFICISCFDEFHIGKENYCEICKTKCKIKVSWFGKTRPQNKHFGDWIIRPGYVAKNFSIIVNGLLQCLILPSIHTDLIMNTFWIVINFLGVSHIVENTSILTYDMNPNPKIPNYLQENLNIILKGFVKMIVTWIDVLLGLYLGEPFYEHGLFLLSFLILPATWSIFCELRKKIHCYVEKEMQFEFL